MEATNAWATRSAAARVTVSVSVPVAGTRIVLITDGSFGGCGQGCALSRESRMVEMNVKSDSGIERERLESYRLNFLRIEPDTHVVHRHRGGGTVWLLTHQ
jgi:hypothetical protein